MGVICLNGGFVVTTFWLQPIKHVRETMMFAQFSWTMYDAKEESKGRRCLKNPGWCMSVRQ